MPDDHDVLMNEYLTDLRISGFEMIISEACYSNIVAVLCYATLKICQSGSNETSQICYDNCTDFNSVIMNECPYFVISHFSQLISNSSPCENLNNQRSCISLDNIVSGNSNFHICDHVIRTKQHRSIDMYASYATISALSWCCTHQLLNTLFEIYLV